MTQTMDLNKMGLVPMSNLEMQETDGGNMFFTFAKLALQFLYDHKDRLPNSTTPGGFVGGMM